MKYILPFILVFAVFALQNCMDYSTQKQSGAKTAAAAGISNNDAPINLPKVAVENYWYQGKAELTAYNVEQERYGEIRAAEQVNIFVTEDFSAKKQVKLDDPAANPADRVPMLKLNTVRKFKTGIYDYSLMQSIFTPMDAEKRTLKSTCSIQDWCGHIFTQLNWKNEAYQVQEFSYFESDGDKVKPVKADLLEDEIWTKLRLNPQFLSEKEYNVVPASFYCRLRHQPLQAQKAKISIQKQAKTDELHLDYVNIERSLVIQYENTAPYRILGWTEIDKGKTSSKGTLKKVMMSDYWAKHDNASAGLRNDLGLTY
jgi:hypothetical protein